MRNPIESIIIMLIFIACGAETSSTGSSDYDAKIMKMDTELSDQFSTDMFTTNPEDEIGGYYGQRIILSGIAEVPVLGFQETNTVGLALVEINNDNGILSSRIKTCETKIQRPDDIVTTVIPEAFIESLPITYRSGFVNDNSVELSRLVELNGIRLNDPLMDDLPDNVNDERIYDQDGDGYPGVTVFVSGLISGQINLIQRTITQLSGQFLDGKISGIVRWDIDEQILDSDQDLLKMGAPIIPNEDESRSVFELVKIPEEFDCSNLIENSANLFDPEPLILNPSNL